MFSIIIIIKLFLFEGGRRRRGKRRKRINRRGNGKVLYIFFEPHF
jgi:hypothetical protein